ncbi:hypothetical protein Bca4012_007919 [Brassica carinata]
MAGVLLGTAISCVKIINMLLRCQRAIQLNEIPSYAHMLSGHEYNSSLFPSLLLAISTLTNRTQHCPLSCVFMFPCSVS